MQNPKQRGVDDQGLWIAYQLRQDGAPQGLKVAPELAHPPMQRGGVKTHSSGEQVPEEALNLAQERTLRLHASKLLEEGEAYDLRVRELLEGLVVSPLWIEEVVSVVYSAEQNGQGLFQEGQLWSKLGEGHLMLLWTGNSDGPRFTLQTTQHSSRDFAVVQRGDPHPELRKIYSNFYNKSVFREDS